MHTLSIRPHLSYPEEGLDVVRLKGQNVSAGVQSLVKLLQSDLSGRQVVQTLHAVVLHLLLLFLHTNIITICTGRDTWLITYPAASTVALFSLE